MTERKRQDFPGHPGCLWVVATPIGNLEDMSPRASRILSEADAILCEDTRHTAKLVSALKLQVPMSRLERLDAHVTPRALQRFVERLRNGERMALVTDAGTPGISDPGAELVELARAEGVEVVPVPGPSAVAAFLSASGLKGTTFCFRGFFPRKSSDRAAELKLLAASAASRVYVWFESPQRIGEALAAVAGSGTAARVIAAKELTKTHERFFSGASEEVARLVAEELERVGKLGEWCFAVEFPELEASGALTGPQSSDWVKVLECLLDAGVSASGAARQVSQHFGAARNDAYETALQLSRKKNREGD